MHGILNEFNPSDGVYRPGRYVKMTLGFLLEGHSRRCNQ